MGYSAISDMKLIFPESMIIKLSNDSAAATTINEDNVAEAIDQADREIDAYVSVAGMAVPLDPVPPLATNLSTKMAIWNLHLRKYFKSEIWQDTYKDCQKLLQRIAEGKMAMSPESASTQETVAGLHDTLSAEKKFDTDFWECF